MMMISKRHYYRPAGRPVHKGSMMRVRRRTLELCWLVLGGATLLCVVFTIWFMYTADHVIPCADPYQQRLDTYSQRRDHVKNECKNQGFISSITGLQGDQLRYLFVDDKHKTLFCLIPKVASTNWLKVLVTASGKVDISAPEQIKGADVHDNSGPLANIIPSLARFTPEQAHARIKNYTKVMFVRHPFERLLSAYKNKFLQDNRYFQKRFGTKIVKNFRDNPSKQARRKGKGVTFEEFLMFITDPDTRTDSNEHWLQYFRMCHPCQIQYDIIGKQESFDEDVQFVLRQMQIEHLVKFPSRKGYSSTRTREVMEDAYKNVSDRTSHNVWFQYKNDFTLFNYEKPSFL